MTISGRKFSATACALAATIAWTVPATAPATASVADSSSAAEAVVPRAYAYTWSWSDGETSRRRTFTKRKYGTSANLPTLVVSASCAGGARVGDVLKLQFQTNTGRWVTEDRATVADCNGTGEFFLNPYTPSGKWAVGLYKYRLINSGAHWKGARFTIIYARR